MNTAQDFVGELQLRRSDVELTKIGRYFPGATDFIGARMGKKDKAALLAFLDVHAPAVPRAMLRLAIERLDPLQRRHYLVLTGS